MGAQARGGGGPELWRGVGGVQEERLVECGTTCTAAVIQGAHVLLAHVGDSTAVLGYADDEAQDYEGEAATADHSCRNEAEAERLAMVPGAVISDDDPPYLRVGEGDWAVRSSAPPVLPTVRGLHSPREHCPHALCGGAGVGWRRGTRSG